MKLIGLNEQMVGLDGRTAGLSYKTAFAVSIFAMRTQDKLQALFCFDLAQKIFRAGAEIELIDSEFALLKTAIEQNGNGYIAGVLAQMFKKLE